MENNIDDQDGNIHEFFKKLISERDARIAALEEHIKNSGKSGQSEDTSTIKTELDITRNTLNSTTEELAQARKNTESVQREANAQIATYKNQIASLHANVEKMRDDYQNLRKQKGGFGFMTILMNLFLGILLGFAAHWLFFSPKEKHTVAFQRFREANQFNFEYDISQGRLDNIESTLQKEAGKKENAAILDEIEFLRKIMGATKRKLIESNVPLVSADGFSVSATEEQADIQDKANKTLTVTEGELTIRSEASTAGEKLGKVKKGETVGVWDRTNGLDKMTTTKEGNRYEVQDYWYKIETKSGIEGWIFGHFTTRSLNRMTLVGTPVPPAPAETTAPKPTEATTPAGGQ